MNWFRFHTCTLDNLKIQSLPDYLFKAWVNILCLASEGTASGASTQVHPDVVAFRLRSNRPQAEKIIKELEERGLLDRLPDGSLQPHDWKEWQYKSDSSTERVRAFRKRSMKREGNVSETVPETETDTETEGARSKPASGSSSNVPKDTSRAPPKTPPARSNGHQAPKPERAPLQTNGLAPPDATDWQARYEGVYALYPLPGWKPEGQMRYVEIIAASVDQHEAAGAIDRSVLEWACHWKSNPSEHVPGIGKWFSDGYYLRKPGVGSNRKKEPTISEIVSQVVEESYAAKPKQTKRAH